jgi:hypothetical protein
MREVVFSITLEYVAVMIIGDLIAYTYFAEITDEVI